MQKELDDLMAKKLPEGGIKKPIVMARD